MVCGALLLRWCPFFDLYLSPTVCTFCWRGRADGKVKVVVILAWRLTLVGGATFCWVFVAGFVGCEFTLRLVLSHWVQCVPR